jgi:hypothetical protein
MSDDVDREREAIRHADEYLTERYGIVLDDIVLRTWGNGQAELIHLLLTAAAGSSGADVDPRELWPIARGIAFPDRTDVPWLAAAPAAEPTSADPAPR